MSQCPDCGKWCKSEEGLKQHQKVKHRLAQLASHSVDPLLLLLFRGIQEQGNALNALRGHEKTLLRLIWSYVMPWLRTFYMEALEPDYVGDISSMEIGTIRFPEPRDLKVNMLPFIVGCRETLPLRLRHYWPLILECELYGDHGKVAYLTVDEGKVPIGESQRRPGLHTEAPGRIRKHREVDPRVETTERWNDEEPHPGWGRGGFKTENRFYGGIYVASSVSKSCRLYKAKVVQSGAIGDHGSVDHLRKSMNELGVETVLLGANELWWMTDRVPHESLQMKTAQYRQFFRVVSPEISVWYADHSTPNPKVKIPDHVEIIHGNKFQVFKK